MIKLENVSKSYQLKGGITKSILSQVTLEIPEKNIAILGPNGAGKSTTLRMIADVEDPDSGRIYRDMELSWPIGFRGSFHRELTGLENVRFVSRMYGRNTEQVVEFVEDFAELGQFFYEPIKTYSSGMGARLAFGISMGIKFDVYLVDELMSVGDPRFRRKSKQVFQEVLKDSKMIMVSHSMSEIRNFCESGIFLKDGNMMYCEDVEDAIAAYEAE